MPNKKIFNLCVSILDKESCFYFVILIKMIILHLYISFVMTLKSSY